jgi:biopolymer transport protein ExbD
MEYSAQRVRAKTRAAVKRREDQVELEEMESGELNLIPYLDIVTNLMLFLLASVSAGIILTQIDTTLPDKAKPGTTKPPPPGEDQPLKLFVSIKRDEMILWSATGLEGTLKEPKPGYIFKRIGRNGEECDGPYMCESNNCDATNAANGIGVCRESREEAQPVFEYHRLNDTLYEIANRRYAGKIRNPDTFQIVLQADGAIPYSTIVSAMASMRCKLPRVGVEATMCMLPTDFSKNPDLKDVTEPIAPPDCPTKRPCKWFDTRRASYDPKTMALFPDIQFSSGFE